MFCCCNFPQIEFSSSSFSMLIHHLKRDQKFYSFTLIQCYNCLPFSKFIKRNKQHLSTTHFWTSKSTLKLISQPFQKRLHRTNIVINKLLSQIQKLTAAITSNFNLLHSSKQSNWSELLYGKHMLILTVFLSKNFFFLITHF